MQGPGQYVARYEVEQIKTPVIVARQKWVGSGKGFEIERIEVTDGYMIYFPAGHSIFVESEDQLRALNLDGDPQMVDLTTGEVVPDGFEMTPKKMVQAKTGRRRHH